MIAMGPQGKPREFCSEALTSKGRAIIKSKEEAAAPAEKAWGNRESSFMAKFGSGKHNKRRKRVPVRKQRSFKRNSKGRQRAKRRPQSNESTVPIQATQISEQKAHIAGEADAAGEGTGVLSAQAGLRRDRHCPRRPQAFLVACLLRNSRTTPSKSYLQEEFGRRRQPPPSELDVFIVDVADTDASKTLAETLIPEDWAVQRVTAKGQQYAANCTYYVGRALQEYLRRPPLRWDEVIPCWPRTGSLRQRSADISQRQHWTGWRRHLVVDGGRGLGTRSVCRSCRRLLRGQGRRGTSPSTGT